MRARRTIRFISILLVLLQVVLMVQMEPSSAYESPSTVYLGTASSFGVLAGSTITNTGPTTVSGTAGGNIGLHPGTAFPGQAQVTLSGTVHLADAVAEQAKADLVVAYNDAAGRASDANISADLGGTTLAPGVYTSASSVGLTGMLTLDAQGDPSAVFIFQIGSTLTTASASEVRLINGASPCRIFWQVGSSATLGTGSYFVGHIFALESITATTDVEVQGQLLARNGAVTLDSNIIRNDVCSSRGSLSVTKIVSGDIGDMTLPDFNITITGPNEYSDTQTIGAGETYTWAGLVSGTYTLSEGELSEEWNASGTGEYSVQNGETTEVTITNNYVANEQPSYGGITVTKVVSGEIGDMTLPDFEITVTGPEGFTATRTFVNGESFTWENLVPGAYTVTESRTGLRSEWTVSGEGAVQVTANQTASATITNRFVAATNEGTNGGGTTIIIPIVTPITTPITTPVPTPVPTPVTPIETIEIPVLDLPEAPVTVAPIETPAPVVLPLAPEIPAAGLMVLPQTGGNSPSTFYFGGLFLIAAGLITRKKIKYKIPPQL